MSKREHSAKKQRPWMMVLFSICGKDLDPCKVSKKLGYEPDACSRRGEVSQECVSKAKQGHWTISDERRNAGLNARLRNLADFVEITHTQLKEVLKWKEVDYACLKVVVEPSGDKPVSRYELDGKAINKFTSLGVSFGFSYWLPLINETRPDKKWKLYRGAGLCITGKDMDPYKVTEKLGILPDTSSMRGQEIAYTGQRARKGHWAIHRGRGNAKIETGLKNLVKLIEPKQKQLKDLMRWKHVEKVTLEIALEPSAKNPVCGHEFSSELLNTFTELGVGIVFSVWVPIMK